ncbi:MAG: cytochrome P450 [Alphaproteobacteria bacterium]|nr:cytochrome P450 [Alphaproteobacteria bacterium]
MIEFGRGPLAGIDLVDPRTHADTDLRPIWAFLRRTCPVVWHPWGDAGFWVVSRHEHVRQISADTRRFTSRRGNSLNALLAGGDPAGGRMLPMSDGPRHAAIRSRIARCVRRAVKAGAKERLDQSVRARLTGVLDTDAELSGAFAGHVASGAICDLLGVREGADREQLCSAAAAALASAHRDAREEDGRIARLEILMIFSRLVEERGAGLGDDLLSDLVRLQQSDLQLTMQEILYNCYSLLIGGSEEPRYAIVGMLHALSQHPEEWTRLKSGAIPARAAVEEVLRWTCPVLHVARTVVEDTQVGDALLQSGQMVSLWYTSANFDDDVFADASRLILDRESNPHLSFGFGPHFCLGATLARMEVQAVLEALVERVDRIEALGDPRPVYSNFVSGLARLPARLHGRTPRAGQRS